MSVVFSLFIVFVCVFMPMHACNGRHFGVINKDSVSTQFQYFSSEDKVKVHDLKSIGVGTNNVDGIIDKSNYDVSTITREKSKATLSGRDSNKPLVSVSWRVPAKDHAGKSPGTFSDYSQPRTRSEIFSSNHVRLLKAAIVEGRRKPALLVGSDPGANEAEDMNNINKSDNQKDVVAVVMDYEPPHKTPPIHNRQS